MTTAGLSALAQASPMPRAKSLDSVFCIIRHSAMLRFLALAMRQPKLFVLSRNVGFDFAPMR